MENVAVQPFGAVTAATTRSTRSQRDRSNAIKPNCCTAQKRFNEIRSRTSVRVRGWIFGNARFSARLPRRAEQKQSCNISGVQALECRLHANAGWQHCMVKGNLCAKTAQIPKQTKNYRNKREFQWTRLETNEPKRYYWCVRLMERTAHMANAPF